MEINQQPSRNQNTNITTIRKKNATYIDKPIHLPEDNDAANEILVQGLASRLVADKVINKRKIRAILSNAWKTTHGVSLTDLANHLFLFKFSIKDEKKKYLY
jgi:kynurenine formamidase